MEILSFSILLAVGVSGLMIGLLLVFAIHCLRSLERKVLQGLSLLPIPFSLASRQGLFTLFQRFAEAMAKLGQQDDSLLQELASLKLTAMAEEVERLSRGTIVFSGTETWRAAYQKLLLTLNVKSYLSVAWVRSSDYWNDAPGRQSMQMNYDLVQRGFHIQRVHILPDPLWPFEQKLPAAEIYSWLTEQQERGIVVHIVREADLVNEPALVQDFAIYGDRATAVQVLDEQSRTLLFTLSFDPESIRQALDRWERLSLFAISWGKGVDQVRPA